MRILKLAVLSSILISAIPLGAQSAAVFDEPGRTLIVGTKEAVPFAIEGEGGKWSGISIDLLDEVMSQLGWTYQLKKGSLDELLDGVANGEIDLAISAITITPDREIDHDFSHSYYSSGLGIAVSEKGGGWSGFVRRLFSPQLMGAVGLTILFLLIVGWLAWLAERKANPEQFGGNILGGIGQGFWFSAVTMTTVGYGDKAPITRAGRLLALIWMFTSLIAISSLTAAITSALTLNELESGVSGPADLVDVKVGTVELSTSVDYLDARGISSIKYPTAEAALQAVADGEVIAVVYDAPILRYRIITDFPGELTMVGEVFDYQRYGVAFDAESRLREPFNQTLLRVTESSEWGRIVESYLGSEDE